ncbi:MAG: prepilin-type N-terminal cleavage/methylation domain-containing protein [Verrucomicrobia bacterium]|nr:prepilin-type N-terminal cleavage/methylation domain-containing protein [Verrucomicrobiota bacterium]
MKLPLPNSLVARGQQALTLVEMMVTMGLFGLAVSGLITLHIFGLRQDQLVQSKLGSSDQSRRAFDRLTGEIRAAKLWRVGHGTESSFAPVLNGTPQQGTAVQISLSTDTNQWIRYYFDTNYNELRRTTSVGGEQVIARNLTNSMFFRAEDYLGNLKTDLSYKYVVRVILEFYEYQYPLTQVGPGHYYDYYKLEFKITPHCPDGA